MPPALTLRCSFERVDHGGSCCKIIFMRGTASIGEQTASNVCGAVPFAIWVL